ncbi:MAG TPA: penicillin-binding protein activator [Longimicrobiales bacterium]|nr:penicillin-binding protein activator [Longimicrobiales bacterium]
MTNRMWPVVFLTVFLACAVGETPPEGPRAPGGDAVPGEPGEPLPVDVVAPPAVEAAAAAVLAEARLAYEAAELGEALELARSALRDYPEAPSAVAAGWVGARAAFALRRWADAADMAESFARAEAGTSGAEEARALAELARDELAPPSSAPVRLGVVLPRTGSRLMVRYADLLLEGIQVAVREAEARERRTIELVVADDAGGTRTGAAVAELERRGVIAMLGPLLPQQVAEAAGARVDRSLVAVSPTVPEQPRWENVYTVNMGDGRGAQALGRYAAEAGLTQAALLYPRSTEYERKASAFAVEFEALGGQVRIAVPYDSGTTTFAPHMARIVQAVAPPPPFHPDSPLSGLEPWPGADPSRAGPPQPFALFVAAPDRDVRQIAPQIAFYGLDSVGVRVFGDEAWASAAVRRVVPPQDLEGVIAAGHFPPGRADALADPDFVRRYEESYRRSLETQLPGLGYDAANLVLQALPNRLTTPAALARRFSLLAGLRGATGTFSVRAERVVRTPYLVIIRGGALAPAPEPGRYGLRDAPLGADTAGQARR